MKILHQKILFQAEAPQGRAKKLKKNFAESLIIELKIQSVNKS